MKMHFSKQQSAIQMELTHKNHKNNPTVHEVQLFPTSR